MRIMQDLHEGWAQILATLMAEAEISNRRMARETALHESTIGRILRAEICPTDEVKFRICGVLNKRLDEVFPWPRLIPAHPSTFVAGAEPPRRPNHQEAA